MNLLRLHLILPLNCLIRKNLLVQPVFQVFAKIQIYFNTITEMDLFSVKYVTNILIWLKSFLTNKLFKLMY